MKSRMNVEFVRLFLFFAQSLNSAHYLTERLTGALFVIYWVDQPRENANGISRTEYLVTTPTLVPIGKLHRKLIHVT